MSDNDSPLERHVILGTHVNSLDYEAAVVRVLAWAHEGESRYVCAANVHMVMEGWDSAGFSDVVNAADLVLPDGVPIVVALRCLGIRSASRVYGPEFALRVSRIASREGVPVGLYGGTPTTLNRVQVFLEDKFPDIRIVCKIAPPFRSLTKEEDEAYARQIKDSGARILFVGIGCPRQEKWMHAHRERIPTVMIGVGAAFDFFAGTVRQAPRWLSAIGLEWLFRLAMEPRRLWKRYVKHNPRFVLLTIRQMINRQKPLLPNRSARMSTLDGKPHRDPQ
ncbi:MAG: WecB/TagA/CpsF family glycosyltransferase [Pseudomonadota bacterium]